MADAPQVPKEVYAARMIAMLGMRREEFALEYEVVPCGCDWIECQGWQIHRKKKDDAK